LRKERVTLSEIIELAAESSRPVIARKGHELHLTLPEIPLLLYADKVGLSQVFLNLLNNVAKYTNPGGKISLTAQLEGNPIAVRVKDTGLGIPSKKLPQLFELFTRLERDLSQEGLGVRLHLVKQLVEMHGGHVRAYSADIN
jgi:signal transduction histidine kinase